MARANTVTWLPLDSWARNMGINGFLFNGFARPPQTVGDACQEVWYQSPLQYDDISREDLAIAIHQAEQVISEYVGYNLMPDWDIEVHTPPRYYKRENTSVLNIQGRPKSIEVDKKYVIQTGIKAKNLLAAGVTVNIVDNDGDGFNETAQITIADYGLDTNQIRLYYPGENGEDEWEIRPVKFVSDTVIEFPAYQIPIRTVESITAPDPLDPGDTANYLSTVDVYQVYNDMTEPLELIYDRDRVCAGCSQFSTPTCGYVQDEKYGFITYNPNLYSPYCRYEPDRVRIPYFSGYRRLSATRNIAELDSYWVGPIAKLAVGFLQGFIMNCRNEPMTLNEWADDLLLRNDRRTYMINEFIINNPFGIITKGAYFAYMRAKTRRL